MPCPDGCYGVEINVYDCARTCRTVDRSLCVPLNELSERPICVVDEATGTTYDARLGTRDLDAPARLRRCTEDERASVTIAMARLQPTCSARRE